MTSSHNSEFALLRALLISLAPSVAAMAATLIPHANSGIFSFVTGPENQVVCNALTGEQVTIKRSGQMITSQKVFVVNYNDDGWGYLLGGESGKIWLKNLGFKLIGKADGAGRVFIQDSVAKRVYYIDDPTELGKGSEKHMDMSQQGKQLTFIAYKRDRQNNAIPGGGYHQPSGSLFWECRTLRTLIDLSYLNGDDAINRWVRDNFGRAQAFWEKVRTRAGFDANITHWMPSEESRRGKLLDQAKKQGKDGDGTVAATSPESIGVAGVDYSENFVCSTQAALFTLLHWGKQLRTPEAKESAVLAFDNILEKCLGGVKRLWVANSDVPCGSITTRGVSVVIEGSTVTNASGLCTEFRSLKAALCRKLDRQSLLELEDQDGHKGFFVSFE